MPLGIDLGQYPFLNSGGGLGPEMVGVALVLLYWDSLLSQHFLDIW